MLLNILAIAVAGFITYMWVVRGFFSALIHLVCTVIAGAVAFAVWEPLAYWMLKAAPTTGVASHLTGMAWGIALIVPFALCLGLLRLGIDKLLPANVVLTQKVNYVGGGVCGLASGVLTAGILVIALGFFRTSSTFGPSVQYVSAGNLKSKNVLWLPLDKATAGFFKTLSERAFRVSEPLAKWHPDLESEGGAMMMTAFEGKNRNTMRPSDFTVVGRFNVGEPGKGRFRSMLSDRWHDGGQAVQRVTDLNGNEFDPNSHIEGFVVNFSSGGSEKDGKISIGSAQVRLVLENADGDRMSVHPIAVSSQAQSDAPAFARWWYDAEGTFIASVGGAAESMFSFEFPCPPGYEPIALYIKGSRHEVASSPATAKPSVTFRSTAERDGAIASGLRAVSGGAGGPSAATLDTSGAVKAVYDRQNNQLAQAPNFVRLSDSLMFNIQKGMHDTLEIDEGESGMKNLIVNGQLTLPATAKNDMRVLEKPLKINRLQVASDQNIVHVEAPQVSPFTVLNRAFTNQEGDAPPTLWDTNNTPYVPIGYIYEDETKLVIRYTPGQPIERFNDLPKISMSRPAQHLTLIYRVSKGVSIMGYGAGSKITVLFDPPMKCDQNQGMGLSN